MVFFHEISHTVWWSILHGKYHKSTIHRHAWANIQNKQGLTHWGRVTHICVGNLTIIGSESSLSPGRRKAIFWTNTGIFLIEPPETNSSEMSIEIHTFSFKKMHLKMSSVNGGHFVSASKSALRKRHNTSCYHISCTADIWRVPRNSGAGTSSYWVVTNAAI